VIAVGLLIGCGAPKKPKVPAPQAKPAALPVTRFADPGTPEVKLVPDRVGLLISNAESEFAAGELASREGRPVAAREHFDRAIEVLLATPGGAVVDPRLKAALDGLIDRISALDLLALREGDGFTEARSEPAVIDELLGASADRPAPAPNTEAAVRADLGQTVHDVPITINSKVLSYVELFQGRMKGFIEEGLNRGLVYLPMIEEVFRSEGVPLDLAYVPLVESAFKSTALSRASARGMWQFMQGTAQEHDLQRTWFIDERSDPEKATRAAATYLKTLNEMFDGDWNLALASYNAGPARIQRAIRLSKSSDYWKITASSRYLPRETREYVPMILAAIIIGRNPEGYGFNVSASAPVAFEKVTVPDALDLKYIAEWAGVTVAEIQALNPELRRTTTPSRAHEIKVPMGTAAALEAKLATVDPSLFAVFKFHTVKRGETLTTIAKHYKLTTTDLRLANDLRSNARVRAGQTLMIPERRASTLPARPASSASASAATRQTSGPLTYRVRSGDTLYSIARQFDTTVARIKELNKLSSSVIKIGERLTIRR
jgi:membrane-bound lytic murein transglycosylase D